MDRQVDRPTDRRSAAIAGWSLLPLSGSHFPGGISVALVQQPTAERCSVSLSQARTAEWERRLGKGETVTISSNEHTNLREREPNRGLKWKEGARISHVRDRPWANIWMSRVESWVKVLAIITYAKKRPYIEQRTEKILTDLSFLLKTNCLSFTYANLWNVYRLLIVK